MRRARLAAIAALAIVALAVIAVASERHDRPYRVSFVFADAGGLRTGGDIRVRGVRAGRIDEVKLIAGDRALVRSHLFRGVGALRSDASAKSRPTGLLGEQYVDLDLGRGGRASPSGARVPLARTGTAVSLADVLDVLDAPTRTRLQILIADVGVGLAGRGGDLRRLLAELPDTTGQIDAVIQQLRRRRVQLRELIRRSEELLTPAAAHRTDLGDLADEAAGALRVAASRRAALGRSVDAAPAALARLTATAGTLGDAAQQLRPSARQLRLAAPQLQRVLARLPAFRGDVRGVLATARSVSPRITRFARTARLPLRQLAAVARAIVRFELAVVPTVNLLGDGGTNELFRFVDGFSQIMEEHDAIGSLVRMRMVLGELHDADAPAGATGRSRRPGPRPVKPTTMAPHEPATPPAPPAAPRPPGAAAPAGAELHRALDYLLEP